jgi:hypothetical protein
MLKGRIRQWKFYKYICGADWAAVARLHKMRKDAGKRSTEFLVHGQRKTVADLLRYIKSRNMTEDEFLIGAFSSAIPAHVQCRSPEPEELESSPLQTSSNDSPAVSPGEDAGAS